MSQTLKTEIAVVGIDIGDYSTLLALMSAARSFCGRSGRVARWKCVCQYTAVPDRYGSGGLARIISVGSLRRLVTMAD